MRFVKKNLVNFELELYELVKHIENQLCFLQILFQLDHTWNRNNVSRNECFNVIVAISVLPILCERSLKFEHFVLLVCFVDFSVFSA